MHIFLKVTEIPIKLPLQKNSQRQYCVKNIRLFNVLGDTNFFDDRPLKDLLIKAIRYGDKPETKQQLDKIIDASVSKGIEDRKSVV